MGAPQERLMSTLPGAATERLLSEGVKMQRFRRVGLKTQKMLYLQQKKANKWGFPCAWTSGCVDIAKKYSSFRKKCKLNPFSRKGNPLTFNF